MDSDERLFQRFAAGDRAALGELAGRYEVALLNLAVPLVGSRELAMDAVRETWLRVIRYAGSFNGRSSLKTWLYRIAINQCRSARAASSSGAPATETEPEAQARGSRDDLTSYKEDPTHETVRKEDSELLKQAVEQLPPDQREAILLCYMQGLTHTEAAESLEIPIGTLKSRIHAALEQLRAKVKP